MACLEALFYLHTIFSVWLGRPASAVISPRSNRLRTSLNLSQSALSEAPEDKMGPQVAQADESGRILARAIQLHQAGDFEGAVHEYQAFLATHPQSLEARSNLGAALAHLGRFTAAIEQYQQALAITSEGPRAAGVRFNLAVAYYKSGQIPEALTELERLLNSKSATPVATSLINATMLLGDCYLRLGQYKKVIALLSPLEAAHRDDLAFAYLLGMALIRDHQVQQGQMMVDRILRHGDSAEARVLMGTTKLETKNDTAGALEDLKRATELNPNLPTVHSLYGKGLMQAGDRKRALEAFRRELVVNPNDFDSNLYLGFLLKEDENYDDALRYLKRALEVRPGDPGVRYQIGALNLSVGKIEEAQRELEQVIKDTPNFIEAHVSLATVYYREKRKQDGDRERALIEKLNAETQAKQAGVKDAPSSVYRGESQPKPAPH